MTAAVEIEIDISKLATRNGQIKPTSMNVATVLDALGSAIRYDEHARRIMCGGVGSTFPEGTWTDTHTTAMVQFCEAYGLDASPATVDRAVALHAWKHRYNALTDFINQCAREWDGVERLDAALCTYWHAEDTEATRITSRTFFLSLAARGLMPGCKVDTCVAFVGGQGGKKSSALAALVGEQWFSDSPLPIGDKDGMQNLPGKWLWEFSENASLARREVEQQKAFLSSKQDTYRASYGRHAETVPRQICFAASTNKSEFLTDPTGNRRHLPVVIPDDVEIDLAGIARDRVLLIAEAAVRVQLGEPYWLEREDNAALEAVREAHTEHDPWRETICAWIEAREGKACSAARERLARAEASETFTRKSGNPDLIASAVRKTQAARDALAKLEPQPFTTNEVLAPEERTSEGRPKPGTGGAVPTELARLDNRIKGRVANILRELGYEPRKENRRVAERGTRHWHRKA